MNFPDRNFRLVTALLLVCLLPYPTAMAEDALGNLVLVTVDGIRWQEVFDGVDPKLIEDSRYSRNPELLKKTYWHEQRSKRRQRLFPFLWSVIASEGVLVGDREHESYMDVSNSWWFSYPGYNEILTGRADPAIDSNDPNWNANVTFLEILNGMTGFTGRVLAFGSWKVLPYIINAQRSGIPVNAGFAIETPAASEQIRWLNNVSAEAPKLWSAVRVDFITHGYAMEALRRQRPRVLYIAYGETDDFAHDRSYDRYVDAAHRTDQMLSGLWDWLQTSPFYDGRTTLIITTDHGRGNTPDGWPHHASAAATAKRGILDAPDGVVGSNEIWLAAIGPSIHSKGLTKGRWKQSQIAATALASLQLDPVKLLPRADKAMLQLLR